MSSYRTEVRNLNYNAATQCFDALVLFHEEFDVLSYPCSLSFPIDSDFEDVTRGLIAVAKSRRASNRTGLVSRSPVQKSAKLVHISDLARQFADSLGLRDTNRAA